MSIQEETLNHILMIIESRCGRELNPIEEIKAKEKYNDLAWGICELPREPYEEILNSVIRPNLTDDGHLRF